jgi:hypothetical protein
MVPKAAANVQGHAIVTCNQQNFGPAKRFDSTALNPEQIFQHFRVTVTRSTATRATMTLRARIAQTSCQAHCRRCRTGARQFIDLKH